MHLVLLHGYLLQGTGSNIYVANIANAWRKQGHSVTVVCQDRQAGSLPFVNEFIGPDESVPDMPPAAGTIRVVTPDINNLLPVYVFDRYEGFTVKIIPDMTTDEMERHIDMVASSLYEIASRGADRVLANHAVLGPVIAKRALQHLNVPYDVKIHGSAIEYTLVPNPHLMTYAYEGLNAAETIVVGSQYVKQRFLEVFCHGANNVKLEKNIRIVPPGMDPDLFKMTNDAAESHRRFSDKIKAKVQQNPNGRDRRRIPEIDTGAGQDLHKALVELGETYDQRATDADLLDRWPLFRPDEPIIMYFGKFLGVKGVGEILITIPEILVKIPQTRFIFVGFGSYREHLEAMIQALGSGDQSAFMACARAGEFIEDVDVTRWFRKLAPEEINRITVTGILDHECLGELLPLASLTLVPSKWPEAFGMVAVESMSAGVMPLCNYYAGLRDVIHEVETVAPDLAGIMKLDREKFVDQLPEKIQSALHYLYPDGFDHFSRRQNVGEKLRQIAVEKFSWDGIARRLLA